MCALPHMNRFQYVDETFEFSSKTTGKSAFRAKTAEEGFALEEVGERIAR